MKSIILHSFSLLAVLSVDLVSGYLFDPRIDPNRYIRNTLGDTIPIEMGEKVVLTKHGLAASAIVALVNLSYDQAIDGLSAGINEKPGIVSQEVIKPTLSKAMNENEELIWGSWPVFGENFAKLHAIGMKFDQPRQYVIKTQSYNHVERINGQSLAEFYIVDGKAIFQKKCTLIIIRRVDRSREWLRMWEGLIPLPFKGIVDHTLVTDTEIGLVEAILKSIQGAKAKYFVPSPVYKDKEYWREFVTDIKHAAQDF